MGNKIASHPQDDELLLIQLDILPASKKKYEKSGPISFSELEA